jgi:Flp pilus assembly protein TadD
MNSMNIRLIVSVVLCCLCVSAAAQALPAETDEAKPEQVATQKSVPVPATENPVDKEISSLREQIAAAPANALLQVRLGYLLLKKGAPNEAQLSFAEALKLNPRSHAAMTGVGIVQATKGDLKEAEKTLREALAQNPNPVRTHYELGVVYEKLGDPDKALQEYKEGISKHLQGRK